MQRRFEINDPKLEQARNAVAAWRARRARLGPMTIDVQGVVR